MNKQKQLAFARNVFVMVIFIIFGVIIITEKAGGIMIPKATKKINNYIDENYKDIKENLIFSDVTFKNTTYTMKITSKDNKNHYFYIKYFKRKIIDTYKKDYLEGKNLLNHIKNKLEKEIRNKTGIICSIEITNKLNKYTSIVQERIIKEDNLLELKFYNIKIDNITIDNWNEDTITNKIIKTISKFKDNNITSKAYKIIITDKNDITKSVEIILDDSFIDNSNNKEIISDIINKKELKDNSISYKYLN